MPKLSFLNPSCRHTEWRKLAKKVRRKRKRREVALIREKAELEEQKQREASPSYSKWLKEQEELEEFKLAEEQRISMEQEKLFLEREKAAMLQWQQLQKKLQEAREERQKQNAKIREEWEAEQKRMKALKEEKERQAELKRLQQEKLQESIEAFINNNGVMPEELNELLHTNPGKQICPFFAKTATCRFGDVCSRDHIRPTISKTLLFKNFYSHYSLDVKDNEHGDASLEFDMQETYGHFREFFNDVVPELEKLGIVQQFKVCCNKETHLRGNVYVEYATCREAIRSYRRFNGRFYAGKQLNVEFCTIDSWKSAICGLFFRQKCPKGSVCNFLHVFRNPGNLFIKADRDLHRTPVPDFEDSTTTSQRRDWRWSESPEHITTANSREQYDNKYRNNEHQAKRRRSRSRTPSRTRTNSRSKRSKDRSSSRRSSHHSRTRHRSRNKT